MALNAHHFAVDAGLPEPAGGHKWARLVDTNLEPPKDFTPGAHAELSAVSALSWSAWSKEGRSKDALRRENPG